MNVATCDSQDANPYSANYIDNILNAIYGNNKLPDMLFHYTTIQGLIGIINSKELWATHANHLNDSEEIEDAIKIYNTVAENDYPALPKIDVNEKHNYLTFIISFCEDGNKLSQWRAYCGTSGFSIGIPMKNVYHITQQTQAILYKCIYTNELKYKSMDILCKYHCSQIGERSQNPLSDKQIQESILSDLMWIAPYFKNEGFSEEQEWRLIIQSQCEPNDVDYRAGFQSIIPYYRLKLDFSETMFGNLEIIQSPGPQQAHSKRAVEMLLSKHGVNYTGVKQSAIPWVV